MWNKLANKKKMPFASGIDVTLEELIALRKKAMQPSILEHNNSRALSAGQHIAKIRGRGIEFDATREYQAGDDIRRMAWRVTARSLKPHIKIYHEERERPVWLALDLSPSLYFGTRTMFKSVRSIKEAAFLGWTYLHKRERIGCVIATAQQTLMYKPQMREREFLAILKSLSSCSNNNPSFTDKNCLHHLLVTLQQQIRPGNLLFILSDFLQFEAREEKLIAHLASHAQVKLIFIYDPFEAEAPPAYHYRLTDGKTNASFNMEKLQNREHYEQQFKEKLKQLVNFARKHHIALQVLRTDEDFNLLVKS